MSERKKLTVEVLAVHNLSERRGGRPPDVHHVTVPDPNVTAHHAAALHDILKQR
jgi:hypothetical protein